MRTISIQADKANDQIMADWLAHLVVAIPVGGEGLKFDGDLHDGTIVNHRQEGVWSVSFRPSPGGSNARRYASPYAVARGSSTGGTTPPPSTSPSHGAAVPAALSTSGSPSAGRISRMRPATGSTTTDTSAAPGPVQRTVYRWNCAPRTPSAVAGTAVELE